MEPQFLSLWRRYARVLKQRNALLKANASSGQLDTWDHELVEAGVPLTAFRERYLHALREPILGVAQDIAPELELLDLDFAPGWRAENGHFADALLIQRDRDRQSGFTSVGPHRADWGLKFATGLGRDHLSRGQAKSSALAVLFGQALHYSTQSKHWPVIALDDMASELDFKHQQRVFQWLQATDAQVFVTGTEVPRSLRELGSETTVYHVEHGELARGR